MLLPSAAGGNSIDGAEVGMGKIACVVAALCGFTCGGLLNILLLSDATDAHLEQHGIDTFYSAVKPPGETVGAFMILYFLGGALFLAVALLPAGAILAERRMSGARWRFDATVRPLACVLLGALGVAVLNWWMMTGVYRDGAAEGEWYSASTAAIAIPAMQDFTLRYVGSLVALLFGLALVALLSRRRYGHTGANC